MFSQTHRYSQKTLIVHSKMAETTQILRVGSATPPQRYTEMQQHTSFLHVVRRSIVYRHTGRTDNGSRRTPALAVSLLPGRGASSVVREDGRDGEITALSLTTGTDTIVTVCRAAVCLVTISRHCHFDLLRYFLLLTCKGCIEHCNTRTCTHEQREGVRLERRPSVTAYASSV